MTLIRIFSLIAIVMSFGAQAETTDRGAAVQSFVERMLLEMEAG